MASLTIVIPVFNEADNIVPVIQELESQLTIPHDVVIIYDRDNDSTLAPVRQIQTTMASIQLLKNAYGPGYGNAIKTGLYQTSHAIVCFFTGDGSDVASYI